MIGRALSLTGERQRTAIKVGEETVGWLTVDPIKKVSAGRDVSFLRHQSSAFITIAVALLPGAALLAIALARHLTRPLGVVTGVVKQLAEGDYGSRIAARGKDEITELSQNIDTLARTLDDNQQSRQRWIADISHELRTPLAIMRGELEALQDGRLDSLPHKLGTQVSQGAVVVVMLAGDAPYARVYVPEPQRLQMTPGREYEVLIDGADAGYKGVVRHVASDSAFTPYFALTERDRTRLSYVAEITLTEAKARQLPAGVPVQVPLPASD